MTDVQKRIASLREAIAKADREYYDLHQPSIGDADYDRLERELLALEAAYPQYADESSPVRNVSGGTLDGFAKVTHEPPMQSLDKTHTKVELSAFDAFLKKEIPAGEVTAESAARHRAEYSLRAETPSPRLQGRRYSPLIKRAP